MRLTQLLQDHFGFDHFRPGQDETLKAVLAGQDTLAILPTGAGKSLLYQLPAYCLDGVILVVSPLIALMQDQADRIARQGDFRAVVLNSAVTAADQRAILATLGDYHFIFTSPETLGRGPIIGALRQLQISLLVIDEAHCVSEWGPDFRPEYLLLKEARAALRPSATLMLTATAPPRVAGDLLEKLGFNPSRVRTVRRSVNRENIFLAVKQVETAAEKRSYLRELLPRLGAPGVIYLSSRKEADQLAAWVSDQTGLRAAAYHAGLDAIDRYRLQTQFMHNELDLICATSAFGMGVDKNDLRYVIPYHLPASLAASAQELGRAGRDGQPALALLLYAPGDESLPALLNQVELPSQAVLERFLAGKLPLSALGERGSVIAFYLRHGYSPARLPALFAAQGKLAQQRLAKMVGYVKERGCRRSYLLTAFGEPAHPQTPCCDCHQPDWQPAMLGLQPAAAHPRLQADWRRQLAALLKLAPGSGEDR